ncbi:MAG: FecR domain-containing protein [Bacteroidales bacterium]|nr:FecR domain-containing protein [Bacteroidales bacterium]
MKDINEKELSFVARYFRRGLFNPARAWKRFRAANALRSGSGRPAWGYALAGVCAALLVGLFLFGRAERWTTTSVAQTVQELQLPDGSRVVLAPGATLSFHRHGFGRRDREVRMDGRVYFSVARNEALPFEIEAGEGFIRVLGTRFQAVCDSLSTSVDVEDGRVLFRAASGSESEGIVLTRGQHATLAADTPRPVLGEADCPNPVGWATHSFRYENTPLETVLRELNTQFGCSLSTTESDRRLTGHFEGEELAEIIFLIEEALGITLSIQE